eukprot:2059323-Rhodomonas_salina.1
MAYPSRCAVLRWRIRPPVAKGRTTLSSPPRYSPLSAYAPGTRYPPVLPGCSKASLEAIAPFPSPELPLSSLHQSPPSAPATLPTLSPDPKVCSAICLRRARY